MAFVRVTMVKPLQLATASSLLATSAIAADPCSSIHGHGLQVPGAEVISVTGFTVTNATVLTLPPVPGPISGLNFCNVSVILTHPGANDSVAVEVWLPTQDWNGRYQATGGGGYSSGEGEFALAPAVAAGYATSQTDGGNIGSGFVLNPQTLTPDGQINWPLFTDYAYRSIHDMTIVSKFIIKAYYGKAQKYSYWNGCSTGGRQGWVQAQMYPDDYDGILAAAPAANTPSLGTAIQWPYVVMMQEKYIPSQCEFMAFINASIAQCDGLDGVEDGIISNVQGCAFDPYCLVGERITCDGKQVTITSITARIYQKILDGPTTPSGVKLWYGQNVGTGFNGLYPGDIEVVTTNGTTTATPSPLSDNFIRYLLKRDPAYDTSQITYSEFAQLFAQANFEFDWIISSNNPDLSGFRKSGGKMITWHGLGDNIIFPHGTINYRQRVEAVMGGTTAVDEFFRLYLPPGVNHCGGGYGPYPTDPLDALVAWVEHGKAPETLAGQYVDVNGEVVNHSICRYPLVSKYDGKGNPNSASSYTCATSFGLKS